MEKDVLHSDDSPPQEQLPAGVIELQFYTPSSSYVVSSYRNRAKPEMLVVFNVTQWMDIESEKLKYFVINYPDQFLHYIQQWIGAPWARNVMLELLGSNIHKDGQLKACGIALDLIGIWKDMPWAREVAETIARFSARTVYHDHLDGMYKYATPYYGADKILALQQGGERIAWLDQAMLDLCETSKATAKAMYDESDRQPKSDWARVVHSPGDEYC